MSFESRQASRFQRSALSAGHGHAHRAPPRRAGVGLGDEDVGVDHLLFGAEVAKRVEERLGEVEEAYISIYNVNYIYIR